MYLYYDKELKLRTSIIHGEPVRQGSDLNVFVCFDSDFFRSEYEAGQSILTLNITGVGETEKSPDFFPDIAPKLCQFKKVSTNEVSYDLIDGHFYWTFGFNFTVKEATSKNGRIAINGTLSKFNKIGDIDQGTLEEEKALGVANIYVEKTVGLERQNDCSITTSLYESLLREIKWVDSQNINIDTASQVYTDLRDIKYKEPLNDFNFSVFYFYCGNFPYGSKIILNKNKLEPSSYPKLNNFLETCPVNILNKKDLVVEIENRVNPDLEDGNVVLRVFVRDDNQDYCYEYVNNWNKVYPFESDFNKKVDKTNKRKQVYATDENGNQTTIDWSVEPETPDNHFNVAVRKEDGALEVGEPFEIEDATPKAYVDKADQNLRDYVEKSDQDLRNYVEKSDQDLKDYVDNGLTLNNAGLLNIIWDDEEFNETGEISIIYNPSLVRKIDDKDLDLTGEIEIFANVVDYECTPKGGK